MLVVISTTIYLSTVIRYQGNLTPSQDDPKMIQIKRILQIITRNRSKLWITLLLLYSLLILVYQILGDQSPLVLYTPFLIFVPGYAFAEALLPQIHKLEKITVSLALSLAILVGFKSLIETFRIMGFFSEITITTILAIICLIAVLTEHFRK